MKKRQLISALSLLVFTAFAQVVPNKDFVTYPPVGGTREMISNVPSALDITNSAGYISGYTKSTATGRDYLLLKYDLNGNVLWQKSFDYAGLNDRAMAITVDGSGNSFITGEATSLTNGTDIITQKYDANGNILWSKVYNGTANGADMGLGIVLGNGGDVFVCGYSSNIGTGKDFTVIKYNSSGTQQFVYTKNGTSNGDDVANAITFFGNKLYVTGAIDNSGAGTDIYVTSINANSAFVNWSKTQNGTANNADAGNDIKVQGNDILVCGGITNTGTGQDYFFGKYNASNGNTVFTKNYDAFGTNDFATALVLDASNTYAIVGLAQNGANYDYHTVKYTNSGILSWVNKYKTNTAFLNVWPKIAVDALNDFYVSGATMNASLDAALYQITPGGNQSWADYHDGFGMRDAHVDLSVDNLGRIYLASLNERTLNTFDIAFIRYSQTPVYFPPDLVLNEKVNVKHLYYPNQGQITLKGTSNVANEIAFQTMDAYPFTYFSANRISYKFFNFDTLRNADDTTQRIDINMLNSNKFSRAFPFEPYMGMVSIMDEGLPNDEVLDIQGYKRYMIPNVYPNIDLHYYSNADGLKMYYVVKPGGEPGAINWLVDGSTSNSIVGGKLEIIGFNAKVIYDAPLAYQVNPVGNPISLSGSASWQNISLNTYSINLPSYNPALPLVIELDYGNAPSTIASSINNLDFCTFMGGSLDDGFRIIKTDKTNGWYIAVGQTRSYSPNDFPLLNGIITSSVSPSYGGDYLVTVLFNNQGVRQGVNIYGFPYCNMAPSGAILSGKKITVVGNCPGTNTAFPVTNTVNLTPSAYTHTAGPGFCIQFEFNNTNNSINTVKWFTRLNGYGSDVSFKPNSKQIYITSLSNAVLYPPDLLNEPGNPYFNLTFITGDWNFTISKYDSVGVRKWCTVLPIYNNSVTSTGGGINSFDNGSSGFSTNNEFNNKCKIDCDNYGFMLSGECDKVMSTGSKYGISTITNTVFGIPSGQNDAFVMRFNSSDTIVFGTLIGGSAADAFTNLKICGANEITCIGYSKSTQTANTTFLATGSNAYYDGAAPTGTAGVKALINKFDSIGNRTWGTLYGNGTNKIVPWGITTDNNNKFFISGHSISGLSFPVTNQSGTYSKTVPPGKGADGFILGFDSQNHILWNTYLGGGDPSNIYADDMLSLDWNPNGNRLMFAGISFAPAKNLTIPNLFPATSTASYPLAWWTDALNATNSSSNYNTSYPDAYYGWFLTNNIIGIEEYFKDNSVNETFNLFPNPTSNSVYLAFKNRMEGKTTIEVYNQLGQLVSSEIRINLMDYSVITLNTISLNDGVYFVNVFHENSKSCKKLIVTH